MTTRKPKPILPDGFTKEEFAAVLLSAAVFAGPYGQVVMEAADPQEAMDGVADAALTMYAVIQQRIEARRA